MEMEPGKQLLWLGFVNNKSSVAIETPQNIFYKIS